MVTVCLMGSKSSPALSIPTSLILGWGYFCQSPGPSWQRSADTRGSTCRNDEHLCSFSAWKLAYVEYPLELRMIFGVWDLELGRGQETLGHRIKILGEQGLRRIPNPNLHKCAYFS